MTAWVAEILRKSHRECAVCRLAPVHVYDPEEREAASLEVPAESSGTPLCHACVGARLGQDLAEFDGRCLVFEPTLGPETYVFRAVDAASGAAGGPTAGDRARKAFQAAIERLPGVCEECGAAARFRWVGVAMDASLWSEDWLPALDAGELTPGPAMCGRCAAARVARSLEERGLTFEAIIPARGTADGILCAAEAAAEAEEPDARDTGRGPRPE